MRDKIKVRKDSETDSREMKKLSFQLRAHEMELDQAHRKIENLNSAFE